MDVSKHRVDRILSEFAGVGVEHKARPDGRDVKVFSLNPPRDLRLQKAMCEGEVMSE